MGTQVIPTGVYAIMGPGGQLTADMGRITLQQPGDDPRQLWQVDFADDNYTMRNIGTGTYLGTDEPVDQPSWILPGASQPFGWTMMDGPDGDPDTYFISPSARPGGLRLAPSILRIWPPMVALAPPAPQFDFEWTFRPMSN
jgi:hypothetical protein